VSEVVEAQFQPCVDGDFGTFAGVAGLQQGQQQDGFVQRFALDGAALAEGG